jgi:hypothetical protein
MPLFNERERVFVCVCVCVKDDSGNLVRDCAVVFRELSANGNENGGHSDCLLMLR